jgi:hypothetical protein
MATILFNSFIHDVAQGSIDCDTDTFFCMLTTSAYTENSDTQLKRSDVTNEITGTGYTAGGAVVSVTVAKDLTNNRVTLTLGQLVLANSTLTARKAVYYKRRGGAATADELVAVNDFGSDISSSGASFTVPASVITLQNGNA